MSLETMTKIATYTVGAGGVSALTFSNIPQTYTDLVIKASARTSTTGSQRNATDISVQFNGNGSGYSSKILTGNALVDNPPISVSNSGSSIVWGLEVPNADATATIFSNSDIYIPNYTSSHYKGTSTDTVTENNSSNSEVRFSVGLWENTAPITSITLTTGVLVQHSTFTLYGVKAMRTAVGSSIKATGGAISFDGTYVTHTFNSTGLFTPTQPILVDYLVIAGGGGGGATYGAGGGAGGYLTSTGTQGGGGSAGSALYLTSGPSYTVTIGAGGAAGIQGTNNGSASNGSNSTFLTITSTGGGGGAGNGNASAQNAGGDGGSSGGGTYLNGAAGTRTASPVQGYSGGAGPGGFFGGGGGGGAGSDGVLGAGAEFCAGGNGLANSITGSSVTRAGGGGGYISAGGSGGGGAGTDGVGSPGQTNTGSGGGASTINQLAGAGGSGVVIVRYRA